jgi:hypothetical protein
MAKISSIDGFIECGLCRTLQIPMTNVTEHDQDNRYLVQTSPEHFVSLYEVQKVVEQYYARFNMRVAPYGPATLTINQQKLEVRNSRAQLLRVIHLIRYPNLIDIKIDALPA